MPMRHGVSVGAHWWEEKNGSVPVATIEVEYPNKKKVYLTVQILGVSDKLNLTNAPSGKTVEQLDLEFPNPDGI